MGMRLLFVPRIEKVDGSSSMTTVPMTFLQVAMRHDPTMRSTLVVRRDFGDPAWLTNYVTQDVADRIDLVVTDAPTTNCRRLGYYLGEALVKRISQCNGKMPMFDACISNAFASNPALRYMWEWCPSRTAKTRIPLVSWSVWSATFGRMEQGDASFGELDSIVEFFGAMHGDLMIWESEIVKNDHLKMFREYFKPSLVEKFMKRSIVHSDGIWLSRVDATRARMLGSRDERKKPVLLWSGYWAEDGMEIFLAMQKVYSMGLVEKIILNPIWTFDDLERKPIEALPYVEFIDRCPRDVYLGVLSRADIFVSNVPMATYGIRFGEMLGAGLTGVINPLIEAVFIDGKYPYVHRTPSELVPAIVRAVKEWPNDDLMEKTVAHLKTHHDCERTMVDMYESIKKLVVQSVASARLGGFEVVAADALKDATGEITHADAIAAMRLKTRSGMDLSHNAMVPPTTIRWAILRAGFEDIGGVEPVYRRIGAA